MRHLITTTDMSAKEIINVLDMAYAFRNQEVRIIKQLFAANLFFEPSTRTKSSFIVAEKKLGIETLEFDMDTSSMKKGESLYDTAKTYEAIGADILVIRHEQDDWNEELEGHISTPIINGGAGTKAHPTQSLLDADTIYQEFGTFENINIVIAGDIKHSRVAKSNAEMLTKLGANVYLTCAPDFRDDTLNYTYISMDEAVEIADALMLLRIQHERHNQFSSSTVNYHEDYGLTLEREMKMKNHAIILHPGPVNRGVEIDTRLVECERSRIFKQMQNGVYVRMAIITKQLLEWGIINDDHIEKRKITCKRQSTRNIRFAN